MIWDGLIREINININLKPEFCKVYIKAKVTCKLFPKESNKNKFISYGNKVTGGIWRPATVELLSHSHYYFLLQNKSTHKKHIYFLRNKSKCFNIYRKYEVWVQVQHNTRIWIFGYDHRGEFTEKDFLAYLKSQSTILHLTIHDSPASNGGVKHANHMYANLAHTMLIQSGMSGYV